MKYWKSRLPENQNTMVVQTKNIFNYLCEEILTVFEDIFFYELLYLKKKILNAIY